MQFKETVGGKKNMQKTCMDEGTAAAVSEERVHRGSRIVPLLVRGRMTAGVQLRSVELGTAWCVHLHCVHLWEQWTTAYGTFLGLRQRLSLCAEHLQKLQLSHILFLDNQCHSRSLCQVSSKLFHYFYRCGTLQAGAGGAKRTCQGAQLTCAAHRIHGLACWGPA